MDTKTVIISRTDSIGDVILTLPTANILRKMYPKAKILFLGSAYTRPIIECCGDIDEFLDWTEIQKLDKKSQANFFKKTEADTIIHVFPNKEISRIARKAKIKNRIGTSHRLYHWFTCNRLINFTRKRSDLHEAQLNLKLLTLFDKFEKIPDLSEMHNYINFNEKCNSGKNLELLDKERFNLILHPKSKGSAKEWGTDNFEKLTEILPKDKFKIFICGTENERKLMPELAEREDVTDLTGTMSLDEYISFIAHADGLVAASTGPLHIAAVTNINAIGIYPPIRPMHSGRWAALGNKVKIFETKKECETCRKTTFCQCMRDVTPQAVKNYLMLICKNK